jgi:hypothetical protein
MERPQEYERETPPAAAGVRLDEAALCDLGKEFKSFYASGQRLGLSVRFVDWWLGQTRN